MDAFLISCTNWKCITLILYKSKFGTFIIVQI